MKVALYIGDHVKDALTVRAGWWVTRLVQRGEFRSVTHCEAILDEYADGSVQIGSASIRDGGVRTKVTWLNPDNWIIVDVPLWDVALSREFFEIHRGAPYSLSGAIATVLPGAPTPGTWFCNHAVGYPFLRDSSLFVPAEFAVICFSPGADVTREFFLNRPQDPTDVIQQPLKPPVI